VIFLACFFVAFDINKPAPKVPALIAKRGHSGVKACIPEGTNGHKRIVSLLNGTQIAIHCIADQNPTQLDVNIVTGPDAQVGGERVLLGLGSINEVSVNPGDNIPK
jgi:hypothetical protein